MNKTVLKLMKKDLILSGYIGFMQFKGMPTLSKYFQKADLKLSGDAKNLFRYLCNLSQTLICVKFA